MSTRYSQHFCDGCQGNTLHIQQERPFEHAGGLAGIMLLIVAGILLVVIGLGALCPLVIIGVVVWLLVWGLSCAFHNPLPDDARCSACGAEPRPDPPGVFSRWSERIGMIIGLVIIIAVVGGIIYASRG